MAFNNILYECSYNFIHKVSIVVIILQVDINECDEYGYTGLHMAAENGHTNVVEALIAAKAKLNCPLFDSCLTPLHMALSKVSER